MVKVRGIDERGSYTGRYTRREETEREKREIKGGREKEFGSGDKTGKES